MKYENRSLQISNKPFYRAIRMQANRIQGSLIHYKLKLSFQLCLKNIINLKNNRKALLIYYHVITTTPS